MTKPLSLSFELFPPRTPEAAAKLPDVIKQLAALRPDYFSVTHGAGGSDQEGTYETLLTVVEHSGIEVAPHLTCVGSTRAHVAAQLDRYRATGVKRIVALRGDLPATAMSPAAPGEFHYASELVSYHPPDAWRLVQNRGCGVSRDASAGLGAGRGLRQLLPQG